MNNDTLLKRGLKAIPFRHKMWLIPTILAALFASSILARDTLTCRLRPAEVLQVLLPPTALTGIPKNLSGLTWNAETGTLFAVTNEPEIVFELTPEGRVLRSIALRGFKDTEGITHIEGTLFALVEERRGLLTVIRIPAEATAVDHDQATTLSLGKSKPKNKGFESLSYDPAARTLTTMREGKPYATLAVSLDEDFRPGAVRRDRLPDLCVDDVASLVQDPDGTMWVLSEASSRIVHLDRKGRELRRFDLQNGAQSFRAEGITRSPDGRIFVVGEPDILAVCRIPD
jgi:uncharacterized protein YjiK